MKGILVLSLALFFSAISLPSFGQEYALVLSGGGGKGAYQVGVWKALYEYGLAQKTSVISGTSVGGLNAALFAVADIKTIEKIWIERVPRELNRNDEAISQRGLKNIMDRISFSALREKDSPLVSVTCSRSWQDYVGSTLDTLVQLGKSLTKKIIPLPVYFWLNGESKEEEIKKMLLATSAFPALTSPIRLSDGELYSDGGAADNVPVTAAIKEVSPDAIFVVHLSNWTPDLQAGNFPGYNLIDIVPSREMRWIEGMLDFSEEWIRSNIELGYKDTISLLKRSKLFPVEDYWFY